MKTKRIALFTSIGRVGQDIAREALDRGYKLTVIVNDTKEFKLEHPGLTLMKGDVNKSEDVIRCAKNHDIIIYDQELKQHQEGEYYNATRSVVIACKSLGNKRLIISGHIHPTNSEMKKEELDAWKPVQEEQFAALEFLKRKLDIDWSYFYILETDSIKKSSDTGNDFLVVNPKKNIKISIKDYAESILNEVEKDENKPLDNMRTLVMDNA